MTSPLPGYAQGISEDMLLGHIAWYTITQPRLSRDDIFDLVTELGLDPVIVPKPPRAGDAFKRACRYSERKGLTLEFTDNTVNFLIRSVAQNANEVERHLVLEIVDPEGRHLTYHDAAHMVLDRKKGSLNVSVKRIDDELDALTRETLKLFTAKLKESQEFIDAQVIRRMIRDQLTYMHAISVRSGGSVYFIPYKEHELTEALEQFAAHCGDGSAFHSLPLIDDKKQREMIQAAFESEVHDEATQVITELSNMIDTGKTITVNGLATYKNRFNQVKERLGEYQGLVDVELLKAQTEIAAMETQIADFLVSGLVQTD